MNAEEAPVRCAVMLSLLAFAACQSGGAPAPGPTHAETPPPITATPPTASPPSATPPPTTGTQAPPAMAPPLMRPPEGRDTGGGGGGAECQKDSDCALTYVPDEGCCATMCAPKGVTAAESQRRDQRVKDCEQKRGHPCPVPACRARAFQAACVAGACTATLVDDR